jgi:hypothetical protein
MDLLSVSPETKPLAKLDDPPSVFVKGGNGQREEADALVSDEQWEREDDESTGEQPYYSETETSLESGRSEQRETPSVTGREPAPPAFQLAFVVNVQNTLNVDIDLELPPELAAALPPPATYTYVEREEDRLDMYAYRKRTFYRCRLRNIDRVATCSSAIAREALHQLVHRIDGFNGWCIAQVHGMDEFNRVLIDVFDPFTGESLVEWMLDKFPAVIVPYRPKTGQITWGRPSGTPPRRRYNSTYRFKKSS